MATRSRIAIQHENGPIESVYCHWDGYPKGVGATLLEHYTDKNKVAELISLGSLSVLGQLTKPEEGVEHSFESPAEGVTIAYHRDRGERLDIKKHYGDVLGFFQSDIEEWGYLFDAKTGEWFCGKGEADPWRRQYIPLKDVV
jgi:hypothetical protein